MVASPFGRERGEGEGSFKPLATVGLEPPHLNPLPSARGEAEHTVERATDSRTVSQ